MTREEAIKKVRQMSLPKETMEIFEALAPELRESEDERIRKEIIHYILYKANGVSEKQEHEWIAYLEKQKEQKPVEKEITLTSFEEILNTFLFDFANSPIEDCEPEEFIKKHSAEILKAAYKELNAKLQQDFFEAKQEGRREGYEAAKAEETMKSGIENPKKPKIAFGDWGDKEKKEAIITCLQYMRFIKKITNQEYDDLINWLDNNLVSNVLKKKQKEQKQVPISCSHENGTPAEWSEEDKSFYDSIMCEVIKEGMHPTPEQVNWFKSLPERFNLQPRQEWSEEDEKMRNNTIISLQYIVDEGPNNAFIKGVKKEMTWLKSIRPSWKPSEEQMEQNHIRKDAIMELLQGMIQSCKTKNGFPADTLAAMRIDTLETVISRIEEI